MESPDVVLEITRDKEGSVTRLDYKVYTREDDGKSALELCSLASAMFEAEGHEFVGVHINADVLRGITSW